jgi:type I restriction enzyme, R subunit
MWKNVQIERIAIDVDRPLGVLVRSVVGLDWNSAKSAFTQFLSEVPLHPDQITFLDEVVKYW